MTSTVVRRSSEYITATCRAYYYLIIPKICLFRRLSLLQSCVYFSLEECCQNPSSHSICRVGNADRPAVVEIDVSSHL
jgi:hypothetical protein